MPYGGANYVLRRNGDEIERFFGPDDDEGPRAFISRVEAAAIVAAQDNLEYDGVPGRGTDTFTVESVGLGGFSFTLLHTPNASDAEFDFHWLFEKDNTVHPSLLEADKHVFESYDV